MIESLLRRALCRIRARRRAKPSSAHLKGWDTRRAKSKANAFDHCAQIRASMGQG